MEPAYLYKLPPNTHIFRATGQSPLGRWYSLSVEEVIMYGRQVTEFSTLKEYRLVNIMSLTFHNDFMDRIMTMFPGSDNDGFDPHKIACALPIGLFDVYSQPYLHNTFYIGKQLEIQTTDWDDKKQWCSQMLHQRQRYSEHKIDTHFTQVMEKIYGSAYDGFIAPLKWPTQMHDGQCRLFPREICFFNIPSLKTELIYQMNLPSSGGTRTTTNNQQINNLPENIVVNIGKYIRPIWNPYNESPIPPPPLDPNKNYYVTPILPHNKQKHRTTRKKAKNI